MTDETTAFWFECSHSDHDDRPPEAIEVFRTKRADGTPIGNAQQGIIDKARGVIADSNARQERVKMKPLPHPRERESRNDFTDRLIHHGDDARAAIDELSDALSLQNHHELRCPVCGFTERVSGKDIQALIQWATDQGMTTVPLRATRRILKLIGT